MAAGCDNLRRRTRAGFTIIELLVVMAIIAILMAIAFPVIISVREGGNRTGCMENMRQIVQALKMYKEDWGVYPEALYGYVQPPQNANLTPDQVDQFTTHFLYPTYIKRREDFRCPRSEFKVTEPADVHIPELGTHCLTQGTYYFPNGQPSSAELQRLQGIYYFPWDTYDLNLAPNVVPDGLDCQSAQAPVLMNPPFTDPTWKPPLTPEIHYRRQWLYPPAGQDTCLLSPRQLTCRTPSDQTVVTWCLNHFSLLLDANGRYQPSPGAMALVAFLDGRVQSVPLERMITWDGADGNTWQTHPRDEQP